MRHHPSRPQHNAFTLIEILVVLAIIGLLAAILFPVFKRARESGYQASCATNLQQIYVAVRLYRKDEGAYPGSLRALLPDTADLAGYTTAGTTDGAAVVNSSGKGYYKGGADSLICIDDPTMSVLPRSSYGDISTDITTVLGPTDDMGRYVWNYWGYRAKIDTTVCSDTDVSGCMGTQYKISELNPYPASSSSTYLAPEYVTVFAKASNNRFWMDPTNSYDETTNPIDVSKLPRLANRFAPPTTIITHCVYHRLPTSNVTFPSEIYGAEGKGAKDIILRLDGTAEVVDVTTAAFVDDEAWAIQRF